MGDCLVARAYTFAVQTCRGLRLKNAQLLDICCGTVWKVNLDQSMQDGLARERWSMVRQYGNEQVEE